jgi:hypothetical protein
MAVLAALSACSDTHVLTGKFRSTTAIVVPAVPGTPALYVDLVLGHFGAEVAGVVRFAEDKDFLDQPPKPFCTCRHVLKGAFDGNDRLTFGLMTPADCETKPQPASPEAVRTAVADLTVDLRMLDADARQLQGTIGNKDTKVDVTFERDETYGGSLSEEDRKCTEVSTGGEAS